jgi:tetratricopeptide (TPR) repeat protein
VAHLNLGLVLRARGRVQEAVGHYEQAIGIDPRYPNAHGALGEALLALGRLAEARDATRRCLDLLPPQHPLRSMVMQQLERCEEALKKQTREGK